MSKVGAIESSVVPVKPTAFAGIFKLGWVEPTRLAAYSWWNPDIIRDLNSEMYAVLPSFLVRRA